MILEITMDKHLISNLLTRLWTRFTKFIKCQIQPEALDRIFLAIKAQFLDFECKTIHYSFTRTENQIDKIISKCKEEKNVIVLYTIIDKNLSKNLSVKCKENNIPCFEILGNIISDFSKLLKKEAIRKPGGQHVLDEEYFKRIEAVQFRM